MHVSTTCQHYMSANAYFNNLDLTVNFHFNKKYTSLFMSLFFSQLKPLTNRDTGRCKTVSQACHLINPPALDSPLKIFIYFTNTQYWSLSHTCAHVTGSLQN